MLVGLRRIREIVLTVKLARFYQRSALSARYWGHSLAVGVCAQEIARRGAVDAEQALVAGLLHDIGKLWMCCGYPRSLGEIARLAESNHRPVRAIEREMFGMDHCQIGAVIAAHWGLPEAIVSAIGMHHGGEYDDRHRLAATIHIAEAVCNGLDLPYRQENQVAGLSGSALKAIGLDWEAQGEDLFGCVEARYRYAATQYQAH
jgi:putative nucleotidyltransferase with HDIG domain